MSSSSRLIPTIGFVLICATGTSHLAAQADDDSERRELKRTHRAKEYSWVDERIGNCHMSGILTIFDHGYAIWTASTTTDDTKTGDVWHESVEVLDSLERRLFGFGVWDSPDMVAKGSQYNWRRTDRFPAGFFNQADTATSSGECRPPRAPAAPGPIIRPGPSVPGPFRRFAPTLPNSVTAPTPAPRS